ncbi:MAG: hypothetical protein IJS39_02975 [Synergistaceae bacterium]|nr:hypothetical protein [Synergistaceae bacterium]
MTSNDIRVAVNDEHAFRLHVANKLGSIEARLENLESRTGNLRSSDSCSNSLEHVQASRKN